MLTFYNEHHGLQPACTGGAPWDGQADAVGLTLAELERRGLGRIVTPHAVSLASLERVHAPRYLHFLRSAWSDWSAYGPDHGEALPAPLLARIWPPCGAPGAAEPEDFIARLGLFAADSCTPLGAGTWRAARQGADCAINAAHALRVGERASFALTRPAGQHARAAGFGGGCFLNNAALAAQHLLDEGLRRVAILDLAPHHGHGTQDIFYERADLLFVSLHLDPRQDYPYYAGHAGEQGAGAGLGTTMNLPLARGCGAAAWHAALESACLKLAMFRPEALVVSLGGGLGPAFGLQGGGCLRIGERLAHLGLPAAFVFEGGNEGDKGIGAVHILEGFETAA
ncbi:histone deacetylase family protein [Massilia oculi]|uniref:Histone deacetylase family protein n=1 Tax=Massilia hydrophila TaxID=3044279 RepID=A0ABS7YBA8_9BURK|nr:histone deacetylase family protein [Massilia oculi]MCA1855814.1 histone deacetylase family protein [Massilia oculi]